MHFTREPIVETIISAKEGYKLSIKSSKSSNDDEYLVDAIEVVSYGGTFFLRNQERPKPFFLPATDYEIVEVRETRLLLKTTNLEKTIKIAGGSKQEESKILPTSTEVKEDSEHRKDKKRQKKSKKVPEIRKPLATREPEKVNSNQESPPIAPSVFSHLLQPPTSLISESIQKYKDMDLISLNSAPATLNVSKGEKVVVKSELNLVQEVPAINGKTTHEQSERKDPDGIVQMQPNEMISESPKPREKFEEESQIEVGIALAKEDSKNES